MTVRLVDIETRRVVRELGGFYGRILDIVRCFLISRLQPQFENVDFLTRFPVDSSNITGFCYSDI
jgi:hypothetical protein